MKLTSRKSNFWVQALVAFVVLAIGLYHAIHYRWVTDDAFITFRYVRNFLSGLGPVYNPGEHVEGYTHFLWFLLLSACGWLGLNPVTSSIWMGILAYAGILLVFLLITKREDDAITKSTGLTRFYVPLAALLLALNYDMAMWASGGLETALYAFLISLAFYTWFYTRLEWSTRIVSTGFLLFLITLTRPDGALFTLTAFALLIIKQLRDKAQAKAIFRNAALLLLPSIVLGVPYLLWKYSYYGDIFPNTYYAKSGSISYIGNGIFYIMVFIRMYWSAAIGFVILPITALFLYLKSKRREHVAPESVKAEMEYQSNDRSLGSPLIAAIAAVIVYLGLFVVRLGGDFMVSRFIIPVLPLIYFVIEKSIRMLQLRSEKLSWLIASILIVSIVIENSYRDRIVVGSQVDPLWRDHNLGDERYGYKEKPQSSVRGTESKMDILSEAGSYLEPYFRDLPVTVMQTGACMVAYYGNFRTVIEAFGLTDKYISHLPATRPGKIGHEKVAPIDYLVNRGVSFSFPPYWYPPGSPVSTTDWSLAWFKIPSSGIIYKVGIIRADTGLFSELNRRFSAANADFFIPDFTKLIPEWVDSTLPNSSYSSASARYKTLQAVYFSKYPNPTLQKQIEDAIALRIPFADSAGKYVDISLSFYKAKQYVDCINAAQKAIQFQPDLIPAYNNICAANIHLGNFAEGKKAAEQALRIDPNNQLAKNNLAWAERELNKKLAR